MSTPMAIDKGETHDHLIEQNTSFTDTQAVLTNDSATSLSVTDMTQPGKLCPSSGSQDDPAQFHIGNTPENPSEAPVHISTDQSVPSEAPESLSKHPQASNDNAPLETKHNDNAPLINKAVMSLVNSAPSPLVDNVADLLEEDRVFTRSKRRQVTTPQPNHPSQPDSTVAEQNEQAEAVKEIKKKPRAKKLYCTCRKPDKGSPMVQCDKCKEWFHCECVNYDVDAEDEDEDWVCKTCSQTVGTNAVALPKQSSPTTATLENKISRSAIKRSKCLLPTCSNQTRADSYCSDVCARQDALREAGKHNNDSDFVLKKPATAIRRTSASSASFQTGKQTLYLKRSPQVASNRSRSESASTNGSGSSPTTPVGANASGKPAENPIRKNVLKSLSSLLKTVMEAALEKEPHLFDSKESGLSVNAVPTQDRSEKLAKSIEDAMYATLADTQPGSASVCGDRYKNKFRSLLYNLKDKENEGFRKRIITGDLSPNELVSMTPEDMANPNLKSISEAVRQRSLKESVLDSQDHLPILNTYKRDVNSPPVDSNPVTYSSPRLTSTPPGNISTSSDVFNDGDASNSRKSSISTTPTTPTLTSGGRQDPLDDLLSRIGVPNNAQDNKRAAGTMPKGEQQKKRRMTVDVEELLGDDEDTPLQPEDEDDSKKNEAESAPTVWEGAIEYKDGQVDYRINVTGRQVGGRAIPVEEWQAMIQSDLMVKGRIRPEKTQAYVTSVMRELVLLEITPSDNPAPFNHIQAQALFNIFATHNRYGVVGGGMPDMVKDFYIIPLKEADQYPDFVYVIRDIKETKRTSDAFLGLLVLDQRIRL